MELNVSDKQPEPETFSVAHMVRMMKEFSDAKKQRAQDLKSVVFEFSEHIEKGQAFFMDRKNFDDGRHRFILHPDHESIVAEWRATLDTEVV